MWKETTRVYKMDRKLQPQSSRRSHGLNMPSSSCSGLPCSGPGTYPRLPGPASTSAITNHSTQEHVPRRSTVFPEAIPHKSMDPQPLPSRRGVRLDGNQPGIHDHLDKTAEGGVISEANIVFLVNQYRHLRDPLPFDAGPHGCWCLLWISACGNLCGELLDRSYTEWAVLVCFGVWKDRVYTGYHDGTGCCGCTATFGSNYFSTGGSCEKRHW